MQEVLDQLGYSESNQFLHGEKLETVDGYAHIFSKALKDLEKGNKDEIGQKFEASGASKYT
jgi:hypothetical protein